MDRGGTSSVTIKTGQWGIVTSIGKICNDAAEFKGALLFSTRSCMRMGCRCSVRCRGSGGASQRSGARTLAVPSDGFGAFLRLACVGRRMREDRTRAMRSVVAIRASLRPAVQGPGLMHWLCVLLWTGCGHMPAACALLLWVPRAWPPLVVWSASVASEDRRETAK